MNVHIGNQQSQQGRIRNSKGRRQAKHRPVAMGTKMTDGQNSRRYAWLHLSWRCSSVKVWLQCGNQTAAVEPPGARPEAGYSTRGGPQPGTMPC
eukprot:148819-Chlamydomonas_euryale.AAC.1